MDYQYLVTAPLAFLISEFLDLYFIITLIARLLLDSVFRLTLSSNTSDILHRVEFWRTVYHCNI